MWKIVERSTKSQKLRFYIYIYIDYIYLGLMTFLHTLYFFDIYDDDVCFSPLSHMCCFFSLFIHRFLNFCNLYIFHTRCFDGYFLVFQLRQVASLSYCDLFSCKGFQEFILLLRLIYFLGNSYGDCCFLLLS